MFVKSEYPKTTVITGDSRRMEELKDESVHLIITSPPYWQLKDYGNESQIGFHDSYEDYINNLNLVWNECFRVLHKGRRLCVNIGDQFARSVYYGRYKVIPIRTEIIKFCETVGFDYMGAIIWQKVTTMNTTGGATIMGSFPYPRNGIVKLDYEFIRIFSFIGETVLDPFLGSGTTSLAAKTFFRNSIGYEINRDFLPLIKQKIGMDSRELFKDEATFESIEQPELKIDFKSEIDKLPYIFR